MENRTGQFISERRKAIGLTQKELAERLGVTNKAVSKWETGGGMPDVSMLRKLSEILEVSVDELLAGEYAEERKGMSLHKPGPELRAPGMKSGSREHHESSCKGKRLGQRLARRILAGLFFLPLVLTVCMHAAYLYVSRQSTFEYIIDWLPYLFFGISILMAACGLCLLVRNKKQCILCAGIAAVVLVLLLSAGICTAVRPEARKSILSISPDGHMTVLKYERSTGRVTTYQNQILWFARMSDAFPYTAEADMKLQWLADDACAVTYQSPDDGQLHQYVMTYGDRRNGITTYYVYNVVQGGWSAEGKNTAGWELTTGPEGITVVSPSDGEQVYEADDCVQFGTLAIALCENGLPQWTLVLLDDCAVGDVTDVVESGTIALCKVTMEKSAPMYFTRTGLPDGADREIAETPSKEENGEALRDRMKQTLREDPALSRYESGLEERYKLLAVNGVDVDCQILHMELLAGDRYDCAVRVKEKVTYGSDPGGETSASEMETTFRIMKGEGAYLLAWAGFDTDPAVGLDAPAMAMERDTAGNEDYHFFVPGEEAY